MKLRSQVVLRRKTVARLLTRCVVALTSPSVTAAWIRPVMWARRLPHLKRGSLITDTRRILILRPDGVGDVVMTGPLLRELRRARPDAHITLVVRPEVLNLVETCPYVNEVLTLRLPPDSRWWRPLSRRLTTLLFAWRHLWPERFDLAIAPRWGPDRYETSVLMYLSGAPHRAGHSPRGSTRGTKTNSYDRFFTTLVRDGSVKHEVQRNLALLSAIGMSPSDDSLEVWLSAEDQSVANEILASEGAKSLVAFGLGAGHPKRRWPIERFAEVGRWLTDKGSGLVLVGGAAEEGLAEELRSHLGGRVIDVTNKMTLRQTTAMLARCSLFCGNDAGPMHLAAAVGVPVVEVSCHSLGGDVLHPNSPKRFGPWGVSHRIVRPQAPADGCAAGCRAAAPHCILNVGVDSVIDAIGSLRTEMAAMG
jgi:ADP-heptose:LPS heptosyltransferase